MPLMVWNVGDPVLDGADRRYLLAQPEQRFLWITLPSRKRILKYDQRQIGCVSDALEMRERHGLRLTECEGRRRKNQQCRRATLCRHTGDTSSLDAAICPDAVD